MATNKQTTMRINNGPFQWRMIYALVVASCLFFSSSVAAGPHSRVQELTLENFDAALADPANSLWFLKFYAPWCGHCKRMAPVLDNLAPLLKGKMAIGKIDCTVEKKLCNMYNVRGFPSLRYARDGDVQEYIGSREGEEIAKFAEKMSTPSIQAVATYDEATQLADEETEATTVGFVVYHPDVSGDTLEEQLRSTALTKTIQQVSRRRQANANFYLYTGEDISAFGADQQKPFLAKVEKHVKSLILYSENDASVESLLDWVDENNMALVSALGPHNFNRIGRSGRPMVIGAVDGANEDQVAAMKYELAQYAAGGPKTIVEQYRFGWIDGVLWQSFLKQFDVLPAELPQYLVLDVPTKVYWQNSDYRSVGDFLVAVDNDVVRPKDHESNRGFVGGVRKFEHWFFANLPYSLLGLLIVAAAMIWWILPGPDEFRPPYPKDHPVHKHPESKKEK